MKQPVKRKILEEHPEINKETYVTLLIDGNNVLRYCFKDPKINTRGEHYGAVFQFLLQLKIMLLKIENRIGYIYVFFDDGDSGILRYAFYNDYKANRDKNYGSHVNLGEYGKAYEAKLTQMQNFLFNKNKPKKEKTDEEKFIDENFARERDILLKYFNELYIRWIFHETVEGDDFIAYYCKHKKPEERIVIMSSDQDLTQLISDTVCVYDHRIDKFISKNNIIKLRGIPSENVVIEKIFCGDASDNIKNISGVSKARLHELIPEIEKRPITIEEVKERAQKCIDERIAQKKKPLKWHENIVNGVCNGNYNGDFYEINKKIIDLSNPLLTDDAIEEIDSMMYNVQDIEGRSFSNLYNYIVEDGIDELKNESKFASFFEQFKILADKEIKRYKKEFLKENE